MSKQKNQLAALSRQQETPGLAKPEDFPIVKDGDAVFTGQRSDEIHRDSDKECSRPKFAGTPDRNTVEAARNVLGGDGRKSR